MRARRKLQIRKMRGVRVELGRHSLDIGDDGITVTPRFEARLRTVGSGDHTAPQPGRMGFGSGELDQMLSGGVAAGSTTMLVGPTGAGKTILGLQFVATARTRGAVSWGSKSGRRDPLQERRTARDHEAVEAGMVSLDGADDRRHPRRGRDRLLSGSRRPGRRARTMHHRSGTIDTGALNARPRPWARSSAAA